MAVLPSWLHDLLEHFGLTDIKELQTRITDAIGRGSQAIATYVYSPGPERAGFGRRPSS